MSIKYTGKIDIKDKINSILDEMLKDEEFTYTIQVYENRENDQLSKFMMEIINIENSMPSF